MSYYNPFQAMQYPPMEQLPQMRQQYQPQYPQMQAQQQTGGLIWVQNEFEARNYLVAPNCAVTMRDANAPVIYLKKTDASGQPDFEVYDKRIPVKQANPNEEFLTRAEFYAFVDKLRSKKKEEKDNE